MLVGAMEDVSEGVFEIRLPGEHPRVFAGWCSRLREDCMQVNADVCIDFTWFRRRDLGRSHAPYGKAFQGVACGNQRLLRFPRPAVTQTPYNT